MELIRVGNLTVLVGPPTVVPTVVSPAAMVPHIIRAVLAIGRVGEGGAPGRMEDNRCGAGGSIMMVGLIIVGGMVVGVGRVVGRVLGGTG